jgi:hypothetical protein
MSPFRHSKHLFNNKILLFLKTNPSNSSINLNLGVFIIESIENAKGRNEMHAVGDKDEEDHGGDGEGDGKYG